MNSHPRLRVLRPVGLAVALCMWAAMLVSLPAAEALQITVHADEPGAPINPAMRGVFFEDINFGADGGLYAELVKNRSFEFLDHLMGRHSTRALVLAGKSPSDANSFQEATRVAPVDSKLPGVGSDFRYAFKPYSLTVLSIQQ